MEKFHKNIVIYGDPKAQKRHRSTRAGNFIRQYDPSSKDKDDFLLMMQKERPSEPILGEMKLYIVFCFSRPKSHYRTGKNANMLRNDVPIFNAHKPDIDNLLKFVMDAMNGVFYKDDSQIVDVDIKKQYSNTPCTLITIEEL